MAKSAAERAREKAQKMKAMMRNEKELKSKTMEEVREGLKVVKDESETLATNETKKEEKPKPESENPDKKEGSEIEIVRDGLLIPKDELEAIVKLRGRAFSLGIEATKTEVYRAGLKALTALSDTQLKKTFNGLQKVKTGRKPNK